MSLLLDALNKTSAKSSSSDDATNPDGLSQSAELSAEFKETQAPNPLSSPPADTDSKFSTGPSNVTSAPRELELELRPEDESETAIETELDGELSIDDATLDGLINDHPADRPHKQRDDDIPAGKHLGTGPKIFHSSAPIRNS